MPFYDFRCKQCGHFFTIRASFAQKDAGLKPECPVCHQLETQRALTTSIMIRQGKVGNGDSLPLPMSGVTCGCGSGGCG